MSPHDEPAAGATEETEWEHLEFPGIGTKWEIDSATAFTPNLVEDIRATVYAFDRSYSRFRPDSLVTRIAHTIDGGTFAFPAEDAPLFELYDRLHEATGGALDPLVGRDLELLGYDPAYTLTPAPEETRAAYAVGRPRWDRDVRRVGTLITTRRPLVVDVGAAGKGYLVDRLTGLLRSAGHTRFTVDGSGDLRAVGHRLQVGLEHPAQPGTVIGTIELEDQAICASATNRRAWREFHHVLDARTGQPVHGVIATWALAPTAAEADGLATALFFTTPARLATAFDFSYIAMPDAGHVEASPKLHDGLFRREP